MKVELIALRLDFEPAVRELERDVAAALAALRELQASTELPRILDVILSIGIGLC